MDTVRLRSGSEEALPLVNATMMSLRRLDPLVLADLYYLCTEPSSWLLPGSKEALEGLALVKDGRVHPSVKAIVASAVSVDDGEMTLSSPLDTGPTPE
jgi:hypothetical protein